MMIKILSLTKIILSAFGGGLILSIAPMVHAAATLAVESVRLDNPSPISALDYLRWELQFIGGSGANVLGVDSTDFEFDGDDMGAFVSDVTCLRKTCIVTALVDTESPNIPGVVKLVVVDDDTIMDSVGNKLGGSGINNGDYNDGQYMRVVTPALFTQYNLVPNGPIKAIATD